MAGDFEKFGVDIEINGVNSAVSNLDRFEKRFGKLEGTQIRVAKAEIALKNAHISLKQSQESLSNVERTLANVKKQQEIATKNLVVAEAKRNELLKNEKATELQILIAETNYANALLREQMASTNVSTATTNLEKARETVEKRTNAVATAELSLQQAMEASEKQQNRSTKSLAAYISKLTSIVMIARRVGHFISDAIQESANYIENLNLFAVAYGDVYQDTLKWALDLADGFGLANNEVLKFAGTFRQLSTSLGLVEDTANSVSKTVTQLGYDMSALFNTSVENAMDKLQSSLFSGNVRPLRAYGIDISQNQIDALFETNEALASLGVNARNLSQSDKVLARLIITLRDGSNAFGTMNREINTLQSQIRILQGSFSNFKLAIGDLVYEPIQRVLVVINGLIIATTNIIRAFKPLTREDANPFNSIAMGAEDANDEIDNLQGKLAGFDKFNVLGGQNASGTGSAITDALVAELEKQQAIYEAQVNAMDDVTNKAKEMAERIRDWFIVVDENGKFLEWTTNAKAFSVIMGVVGVASLKKWASSAISAYEKATSLGKALEGTAKMGSLLKKVLTPKALGITLIVALIAYLYTTNEYFRESINQLLSALAPLIAMLFDLVNQILKPLLPMLASALNILGYILGFLVRLGAVIVRVGGISISFFVTPLELVVKSLATIIYLFEALYSWNWGALGQKLSKLWTNWASINSVTGSALFLTENNFGFANGGYTNANLIMTHENGKREWVGKAAGSSAIVNDTQMSDIMEVAVAKGVVLGNRTLGSGQNGGGQVIHNHIYMNGRQIYESVTETANQFGNTWAKR